MAQKPSIPKGTRDFSPAEVQKRQYVIATLRNAFEAFGFQPIETPSFENLTTLTGKYGDEGDQLIYRILRSGDFAAKANPADWEEKNAAKLGGQISDKALRYDLTVPFARYVVQHQNELAFPFKRYQIQAVWRADRPQKGRFREFVQCDADVVGSKSLWQEVELVQLYDRVFTALQLPVTIRMSNRKVLAGLAEVLGVHDQFVAFTVALDKLDKIGSDEVEKEFISLGMQPEKLKLCRPLLSAGSTWPERLAVVRELLNANKTGLEGLQEVDFILAQLKELEVKNSLVFDVTLARGLNYYTGTIFEVIAENINMGSIGGGGRYDDLTGIFGLKNMSGVGISFGLDRIYLCLEELNLFPSSTAVKSKVLFLNFGDAESAVAMQLITQLRNAGIRAELYPDAAKMKKQFDYAAKTQVEYVAFLGSKEIGEQQVTLKDQSSGQQRVLAFKDLVKALSA
jgi:histidyl-tRNA synthetase